MTTYTNFLEKNWWFFLVRGIAAILFSIAAFAWPGLTVAILVVMFGGYVLVDGIFGVVDAMVLSRLRSGLSTHLGSLSFEGQGAFAT